MFCTKCGKEMKDDMRFCPVCGTRVEPVRAEENGARAWAGFAGEREHGEKGRAECGESAQQVQDAGWQQNGPGLEVREEFAELSQMTQRVRKSEKRWSIVGKVLAVCALFFLGRAVFHNIVPVMNGERLILYPLVQAAAFLLFCCGLVELFLLAALPAVKRRKEELVEAYLKLVTVRDMQALFRTVNQMSGPAVKHVYLDEYGNVCVQGKRCRHMFFIQDGALMLQSEKEDYKAALERESIAVWLLKAIAPSAPVNAYENGRYNSRLSGMRRNLAITAAVSGGIALAIFAVRPDVIEGTDKYIRMVQSGHPEAYPDVSYGEAFDDFFENCRWEYFRSKEKEDVVEFYGNCLTDEKKTEVRIQFLLAYEEGTFELYAASIDGEQQTDLVNGLLLLAIFENYGSADGMGMLSEEDFGDAGASGINAEDSGDVDTLHEASGDSKDTVSSDAEAGTGSDAALADEASGNSDVSPSEELAAEIGRDLSYPIMYRGYADEYSPCPVMVNDETAGVTRSGTYEEMMASLIDDGATLYAQPTMYNKEIYTAAKWDAPQAEWYNGLLTYEQFVSVIDWIRVVHEETGAENITSGGMWTDVEALSGRWSGGSQELAISIYSDIDYCSAYQEIGNVEIGGKRELLYLLGKEGNDVYICCLMEDGAEVIFCYKGDGTLQAWSATAGCVVEEGAQFQCVERFVS